MGSGRTVGGDGGFRSRSPTLSRSLVRDWGLRELFKPRTSKRKRTRTRGRWRRRWAVGTIFLFILNLYLSPRWFPDERERLRERGKKRGGRRVSFSFSYSFSRSGSGAARGFQAENENDYEKEERFIPFFSGSGRRRGSCRSAGGRRGKRCWRRRNRRRGRLPARGAGWRATCAGRVPCAGGEAARPAARRSDG